MSKGIEIINQIVITIPESCGVYKMINNHGEILYVGKAKNLPKRIKQYTQLMRLPNRLKLMVSLIAKIDFILTATEEDALLLESQLIKGLMPPFNIALKDDKTFPYIAIDHSHNFPRIFKYRGPHKKNHSYFGPFMNADNLDKILLYIQKIYKVRTCSNTFFMRRQRPCLLYQIARCSAPCTQQITSDAYSADMQKAKKLLSGNNKALTNQLNQEMKAASKALQFEKAAEIRDLIHILNQIGEAHLINNTKHQNIDIIGIYSYNSVSSAHIFKIRENNGILHESFILESLSDEIELLQTFLVQHYASNTAPDLLAIPTFNNHNFIKALSEILKIKIINVESNHDLSPIYNTAQANAKNSVAQYINQHLSHAPIIESLRDKFNISQEIQRIEVYDNSHIQGKHAVGCMIVSDGFNFLKSHYRTFKIKNANAGDDYSMLKEVLSRRLQRISEINAPDIMLIDGGANHLSVAIELLKLHNINTVKVIAIAKGVKRNAGDETFYIDDGKILKFDKNDRLLYFLQRLRDEVHRFAISTHRKLRSADMTQSHTKQIPGINKDQTKLLLREFGSYNKITEASVIDLQNILNSTEKIAIKIYNYLQKKKDI